MSVIELLENPAVVPVLTAILVVITGIYAFLTYRIASANAKMIEQLERQHESQTRPVISVNIAIEQSVVLVLVISNKGASPALNLRLSLDHDFYRFAEKREESNLRLVQAFQSPIPAMSSGDSLRFDLAQGFNLNKEVGGVVVTPPVFVVSAAYESATKNMKKRWSST